MVVVAFAFSFSGCQFQESSPSDTAASDAYQTGSSSVETVSQHPLSGFKRQYISLQDNSGNTIKILAEIADEPKAQAQGLMFREALSAGEGMLFIFPDDAPRGFWMKNTLIPLDILFFAASGDWVSGFTMTPCEGDPCPSYASQGAAKYALEIPEGSIETLGLNEGWKLRMN